MNNRLTRRKFVKTAAVGSTALAWMSSTRMTRTLAAEAGKPALLGGTPAHSGGWPRWPEWRKSWEPEILDVLRSGRWCCSSGGGKVEDFEEAYAKLLGAKRCIATSSGTTALITALYAIGIDAGDEVIVSPYTFIASYNAIFMQKALPVFADTDPNTLTMDPASIESRITERTRAILPVHIHGLPCDMDAINAIAKKHNLAVVEDACQAWLGEYKGRKCGTLGDLGCFSFQNSKNIPAGEGGAITSNSDELADRCQSYHNVGRSIGTFKGKGCFARGSNFRMTHYQAALLRQQIDKLKTETKRRQANAAYLSSELEKIPGISPSRLPENSKSALHLYTFSYDADKFNGLSRNKFIKAMGAEDVACFPGYHEQYYDGIIDEAINSRGFKRLFPAERLKEYRDSFHELVGNKKACNTTVCMFHTMLLAEQKNMDDIVAAVRKIQAHSAKLTT